MEPQPQLITTSEVARRLRISAERVRQLADSGRLPPDQRIGRSRFWLPETVERFAATRGRWGRFETQSQESS
ncbi:MAG: helix-turn-helix domain-containing protein [Acidimicrobiales bacterium]